MFTPDENGVYVTIWPSVGRRVVALAATYALGALLVWLAFNGSLGFIGTVLLVALGGGILALAERMRRVTQGGISLTKQGLEETSGRLIAHWGDIDEVMRGAFALKPSNGFSLVLNNKKPRAWVPGLWWRMGTRVGVGGVMPAPQTRAVAEQISLLLPEHKNGAV